MIRRGVYSLELAAAAVLIVGICMVSLLAVLGMGRERVQADDWKTDGGGVKSIAADPGGAIHYIGISAGGCAAANCHGGQNDSGQPGDAWKTSAFVFLQTDPHAQAYNVLFEERSRQMIERLAGQERPAGDTPDVSWYIGQLQAKCVSCHATPLPQGVSEAPASGLNHYALGVTCEACHGPASRWGDEHLSARWPTASTQDAVSRTIERSLTGFNELKNLSTAAATCAKCHIGEGSEVNGKSSREVTHDLIAAGHPRLDFDFAAWYASMPPHWNQEREQRSNFHTDAWTLGQSELLRTRGTLIPSQSIQPEFANFDCFSCHQALRFPPSASSYAAFPLTFGSSWSTFTAVHKDTAAPFNDKLHQLLQTRSTEPNLALPPPDPTTAPALSLTLSEFQEVGAWDELVSWYYAADAVSRDAAFAAQSSPDLQPSAKTVEASLKKLKSKMEKYLTSSGEVSRYASPRGFGIAKADADDPERPDPQSVQTAFEEAKQALRALAKNWER